MTASVASMLGAMIIMATVCLVMEARRGRRDKAAVWGGIALCFVALTILIICGVVR